MKKKVESIKEQIENGLTEKDLKRILISSNKKMESEEKKLLNFMEFQIFDTLEDKLAGFDKIQDPQEWRSET